jgi:hypothetical protein
VELYLHSTNTPSWRCAQLGGAQGQLYLYLYIKHIYTDGPEFLPEITMARDYGCFILKFPTLQEV